MSQKSRLNVISRAIESVKNDFYGEDDLAAEKMEAKRIINDILEEQGSFHIEELADRIFGGEPDQKLAFQEKMEKYDLVKEKVEPQSDRTIQYYQRQHLRTDTGIELSIPMDQYKNSEAVQFITSEDGITSIIIKNAGRMAVK